MFGRLASERRRVCDMDVWWFGYQVPSSDVEAALVTQSPARCSDLYDLLSVAVTRMWTEPSKCT